MRGCSTIAGTTTCAGVPYRRLLIRGRDAYLFAERCVEPYDVGSEERPVPAGSPDADSLIAPRRSSAGLPTMGPRPSTEHHGGGVSRHRGQVRRRCLRATPCGHIPRAFNKQGGRARGGCWRGAVSNDQLIGVDQARNHDPDEITRQIIGRGRHVDGEPGPATTRSATVRQKKRWLWRRPSSSSACSGWRRNRRCVDEHGNRLAHPHPICLHAQYRHYMILLEHGLTIPARRPSGST